MLTLLLGAAAFAQNLLAPAAFPGAGTDVYVVFDDGTRLEGHVGAYSATSGNPRYKIKDADGVKHKIEHERVVEAGIRLEGRPAAAASSMQDALRNRRPALPPPEWLTFVRVPVAVGQAPLMMILNPGFDRRMRVFQDPFGSTSAGVGIAGFTVTGGAPTSYLVWRTGAAGPARVEKKGYEDRWDELFGDCPAIPRPDPLKWADFEDHVFVTDQACGDPAPPP